jgi:hypothetical protein
MFELKPDFEAVLERYDAWWECAIVDRPLVSITFPKPEDERVAMPSQKQHASLRERWLDTEYVLACQEAELRNRVHVADALPVAMPNLGPEIFSAFYGCPLEFGEQTSWSAPILHDWSPESVNELQLDTENFYFRKMVDMTDAFIEVGKGKFIVGYTDLHGGGDAIAAFRDPQSLCIDMIEHPAEIKALCDRITRDFLHIYDLFHEKLSAVGMPSTTWCNATCRGKFHVPSNDFSCMISGKMFEKIFLPGIVEECRHMDRCIYHLDGPQALRYLDTLLDIPEIHAIQWVPGAGQEYWADWIDVYQRIQHRDKALQLLSIPAADLPKLFDALRPEGVWISSVSGITNQTEADAALKAISAWGTH